MKEPVSQEEGTADDGKVEELAEDETTKVDVIPKKDILTKKKRLLTLLVVNISAEKLDQLLPLLILILNEPAKQKFMTFNISV